MSERGKQILAGWIEQTLKDAGLPHRSPSFEDLVKGHLAELPTDPDVLRVMLATYLARDTLTTYYALQNEALARIAVEKEQGHDDQKSD